jgi:adenylate cyclase class 2
MSFEIESKYALSDAAKFLAQAKEQGVDWGPPIPQVDRYLRHPARDFAQTGEALRLRRSGDEVFVTYKGPRQSHAVKTRREIELPLTSDRGKFEEYAELFFVLGFEPVAEVAKTRRKAKLGEGDAAIELCFDQVAGLGDFVEIEAIADERQIADAQKLVAGWAAKFGLADPEPRSYLRMLLESRDAS